MIFALFSMFFLMLKFERRFEIKNLRKKRQTDAGVTHFGPARRNVRGAGERKREGFRSLLGQNSGKNILGKHFRATKIESPLPFESSTLVPGGAADRSAHSAGPGKKWRLGIWRFSVSLFQDIFEVRLEECKNRCESGLGFLGLRV